MRRDKPESLFPPGSPLLPAALAPSFSRAAQRCTDRKELLLFRLLLQLFFGLGPHQRLDGGLCIREQSEQNNEKIVTGMSPSA